MHQPLRDESSSVPVRYPTPNREQDTPGDIQPIQRRESPNEPGKHEMQNQVQFSILESSDSQKKELEPEENSLHSVSQLEDLISQLHQLSVQHESNASF